MSNVAVGLKPACENDLGIETSKTLEERHKEIHGGCCIDFLAIRMYSTCDNKASV
jgi:hypothetical protein